MIKEFCDRCKKEIVKDWKKGISFDCWRNMFVGMTGKVDMVVCLHCQKEIKEFATKTIPVGRR